MRHHRLVGPALALLVLLPACSDGDGGLGNTYEVKAGRAVRPEAVGTGLARCGKLAGVEEALSGGESDPPVDLTYTVNGEQEAVAVAACLRGLSYDPVVTSLR